MRRIEDELTWRLRDRWRTSSGELSCNDPSPDDRKYYIDAFVARLQGAGIKTDAAIRISTNASGLRIAFVTDPWGTEIELTEGLATTPIAGRSR